MSDLRGGRGPRSSLASTRLVSAVRSAALLLPILAAACADDPSSQEAAPALAASAAEASRQTYAALSGAATGDPGAAAAAAPERPRGPRDADLNEPGQTGFGNVRQVAALPRADDSQIAVRVLFPPGKVELSPEDEADLSALTAQLLREENPPLEILAYWVDDGDDPAQAKIYAAKRGMKVRSFLKSQGLDRAPIVFTQVAEPEGETDLVDVVLAGR